MKQWLIARYQIPRWFILATLVLALTSLVVKSILAITTYELEQDKLWAIELLGKGLDTEGAQMMIENRPLYGLDAPIWYKMLKRTDAVLSCNFRKIMAQYSHRSHLKESEMTTKAEKKNKLI